MWRRPQNMECVGYEQRSIQRKPRCLAAIWRQTDMRENNHLSSFFCLAVLKKNVGWNPSEQRQRKLGKYPFYILVIFDRFDHSDEWTWPSKRQRQTQRQNRTNEKKQPYRLATFETYDQGDEETRHDLTNYNTKPEEQSILILGSSWAVGMA